MAQISPLRRRMIDDMMIRNLSPATQQSYLYAVAKFSRHFGRSPNRLGLEEVRLADDVAGDLEENATSASLRKLVAALGEFATYVGNNMNYRERFRAGERISTGFVESVINQMVDKRQSMRWTPRGARLLLINGDLDQLIRRRYPAFRTSPGSDVAPAL
jgi:hypothetical protein